MEALERWEEQEATTLDIRTGNVFREYIETENKKVCLTPYIIMNDGRDNEGRLTDKITLLPLTGFDGVEEANTLEEKVISVDDMGGKMRKTNVLKDMEIGVFSFSKSAFADLAPSNVVEEYGALRMLGNEYDMMAILGNASHSSITTVDKGLKRRLYDEILFMTSNNDYLKEFEDFSRLYTRDKEWEGSPPEKVERSEGDVYDVLFGLNADDSEGYLNPKL